MANTTIGLSDELAAYVIKVGTREPEVLARLREETAALPQHGMQIAPEEGAFLAMLVVCRLPAAETLDQLLADGGQAAYDFAFVDADKTGYDGYYERLLRLVRPGGLIAFDNTLWGGAVLEQDAQDADTRAIQALNSKLADDERITLCLLPVADGVTLARRR